jgi:CTP synthase (UTP-ammonia lyase)
VEYARNVLAIQDAEHEETAPDAPRLVISKLTCSLVGTTQPLTILPGTLAHRAYGRAAVLEQFACNYGLNPVYHEHFGQGGLKIAGRDETGEVRLVELAAHRFFMATLFLPQLSSSPAQPHPLIVAYLQATQQFQMSQHGRVTT